MADSWKPNDEQKNGVISRTIEFITDEADELMQELDCPPSYIASILRAIADNLEDGQRDMHLEEDSKLDFYA